MLPGSHQILAGKLPSKPAGATLLERLDLERLEISNRLMANQERRANLGQFMTPAGVAEFMTPAGVAGFMASMLELGSPPTELRVLDAGSGTGILTAAVVAEICSRPKAGRPAAINVTAWEIGHILRTIVA